MLTPSLKFVENEVDKKELYAEFYLEENDLDNLVAVILIDNETHELKENHFLREYFHKDGDYLDSVKEEVDFDTSILVNMLVEAEKGQDLTRNYFY